MKKNKFILLTLFVIVIFFSTLFYFKKSYFSSIISSDQSFFINKSMTYDGLIIKLKKEFNISGYIGFSLFCDKKKLYNFSSGKYLFKSGFTLNDIINELRIPGNRKTIDFSFNSFDDFSELASNLASKTDIDSLIFMNKVFAYNYDSVFNRNVSLEEIQSFFIPNTYNLYWHSSEIDFINRMIKEYKNFWSSRLSNSTIINLSPFEISIIASIVEKESSNHSEMDDIASVYLNRLEKNMKLQADPTVNFCFKKTHDFDTTLTRVKKDHLKMNCQYNTYIIKGLPPGPICSPSIQSIDAVLKNKTTDYIFMCAKAKINEKTKKVCFFDSHIFANRYFQHLKNAKQYQKAMDKFEVGYKICFPDRENCNCN